MLYSTDRSYWIWISFPMHNNLNSSYRDHAYKQDSISHNRIMEYQKLVKLKYWTNARQRQKTLIQKSPPMQWLRTALLLIKYGLPNIQCTYTTKKGYTLFMRTVNSRRCSSCSRNHCSLMFSLQESYTWRYRFICSFNDFITKSWMQQRVLSFERTVQVEWKEYTVESVSIVYNQEWNTQGDERVIMQAVSKIIHHYDTTIHSLTTHWSYT